MISLAALQQTFLELNNLKRIRAANYTGSVAEHAFRVAWGCMERGVPDQLALETTALALARCKLGAINRVVLLESGCDPALAAQLEEDSFLAVSKEFEPAFREQLRLSLRTTEQSKNVPPFVELLVNQPRAGATRPGHARIIVLPSESHADHCFTVAVYAVLVASRFGADPSVCFLAGLSHHLHNAYLPDSGFAGEELLGSALPEIMETFRKKALAHLHPNVASKINSALAVVANANTPEGKAFHAADVIDRVFQMQWYEEAANFKLKTALDEMELVHAGPVKDFHMQVLAEVGLGS